MTLQDYTTDELKNELMRRAEENRKKRAEETKLKRQCRNCKHYGTIDAFGKPIKRTIDVIFGTYCPFVKYLYMRKGRLYRPVSLYDHVCENFEMTDQ